MTNFLQRDQVVRTVDATPEYAIPAAISALQDAISTLELNSSRLRDRLECASIGQKVSDEGKGIARAVEPTPLSAQLRAITDRVEALNYQTLDALDRLHL